MTALIPNVRPKNVSGFSVLICEDIKLPCMQKFKLKQK